MGELMEQKKEAKLENLSEFLATEKDFEMGANSDLASVRILALMTDEMMAQSLATTSVVQSEGKLAAVMVFVLAKHWAAVMVFALAKNWAVGLDLP